MFFNPIYGEDTRNEDSLKEFILELKMMASIRHRNIVQLLGMCKDSGGNMFIVSEFCPHSLDMVIAEEGRNKTVLNMSFDTCMRVSHEICTALAYMHSRSIVHRDLKLANILLSTEGVTKVCDFGLARFWERGQHSAQLTKGVGTPEYLAPELVIAAGDSSSSMNRLSTCLKKSDDEMVHCSETSVSKCDVFSFGICLWALLKRQHPYYDEHLKQMSQIQILHEVATKGLRPTIIRNSNCQRYDDPDIPERIAILLEKCWDCDPRKRPSFDKLCSEFSEYAHAAVVQTMDVQHSVQAV